MKTLIFSTIAFLLACNLATAQNRTDKKLKYYGLFSVARSTFHINIPNPDYPTLEVRLGGGIIKPLSGCLDLRVGLSFGVKLKRDSYLERPGGGYYDKEGTEILWLDESIQHHHFVTDIPVILQINLPCTKLALRGGVNARLWAPNNYEDFGDPLVNLKEIGILPGLTYKLSEKISISMDYYFGLTLADEGSIDHWIYNEETGDSYYAYTEYYKMKNQYAQFSIEYNF